jgi:hypothetical protein
MNILLKDGFKQVCAWPGTTVGKDQIDQFEPMMEEMFNCRFQYLEEIITLPGDGGEGGRNDLFFAVHNDDIGKFAVPRLKVGIRWIDDVLSTCNYRDPIYPERVFKYNSW